MNLILCGFKSSGKSYFGSLLAEKTGFTFWDTDQLLLSEYTRDKGEDLSVAYLYRKIGEEEFRRREEGVIASLQSCKDAIIATGGGCILSQRTRILLQNLGKVVYLSRNPARLEKRLLEKKLPAFFDPQDPKAFFAKMFYERAFLYEQIAMHTLRVDELSEEEILSQLTLLIGKDGV